MCIIPLGGVPLYTLQAIRDGLTADLPIRVRVAPPLSLSGDLINNDRGQYSGDLLQDLIVDTYGETLPGPRSMLLGITAGDIYLPGRQNWRFAFGEYDSVGGPKVGVISTYRLASPFFVPLDLGPLPGVEISIASGRETTDSRTYKMVLKYVGLGYFHLPLTSDPTSVMYNNILGVADLDRMDDELPLPLPSSP